MSVSRANTSSETAMVTTSQMEIDAGSAQRESASRATQRRSPETVVTASAFPHRFANCPGSRATSWIRSCPVPQLANGTSTPASATTPTKAPYPSASSARAMRMKYAVCTSERQP